MVRTTDKKKALIRVYHTICHIRGMNTDDKQALLSGYGVESSKDLTERELLEVIENLQKEPELWRKRVFAAIGAWLRSVNREESTDIIKAIACRASGFKHFNDITMPSLQRVYYEFSRKAKTTVKVQEIISEELTVQTNLN